MILSRRTRLSNIIAPAFWPVHLDIRRGGHGEYWLGGGRGSGKSSFASIEFLLMIIRDPEVNGAVFRKVAATLRESVVEQLLWAAQALGVRGFFRVRQSPMEMTYLPTGQRVIFRGADDPGKLKSIKLEKGHFGCVWFEELTEFEGMGDVRSIKASLVRGGGAATFYTFNPPEAPGHWVNREAAGGAGRLVHRSDYRMLPEKWLGEGFIADAERLRSTNERAYRSMYLGEAVGAEGQVFENLELRAITEEELRGFDRIYCGLDFGFAVDPDAFVRAHYDRRLRKLWLLEEFYGVRTPLERLAAEIDGRMGNGESVACDSADPRMIDELRQRGVRAFGAKKGPGSVERGMRWLQELSGIVIDPARCPNAAREFAAYEYARGKDGGIMAAYPDRENHTIDALRYAMEGSMFRREARAVDRRGLGI
jgi:phage terminase large subunit